MDEFVDGVETLAIERAKNYSKLSMPMYNLTWCFCKCCCFSLVEPGDTILGMALDQGGHLTHGAKVNFSKKLQCNPIRSRSRNKKIDYAQAERLAQEHKPKMIIAGFSAYMGIVDWARFRK